MPNKHNPMGIEMERCSSIVVVESIEIGVNTTNEQWIRVVLVKAI